MPTYRTSDFEAALERLGFRRDKTHHNMFWYYLGDRKTALRTRTSQGEKEFDDSMLSLRRKQVGNLTKSQFLEMLNGRLTEEAYRQHLLDNDFIQAEESQEA